MSVIKPNFNPTNDFKTSWITDKIDAAGIDYLENFGFYLCDKKNEADRYTGNNAMTTSQIRNIFGEVKRIELKIAGKESDWEKEGKTSFLLLRPKIAYATARVLGKSQYNKIKDFRTVIELAHSKVQTVEQFINFSQFLEGIIAYHKVYGGKD